MLCFCFFFLRWCRYRRHRHRRRINRFNKTNTIGFNEPIDNCVLRTEWKSFNSIFRFVGNAPHSIILYVAFYIHISVANRSVLGSRSQWQTATINKSDYLNDQNQNKQRWKNWKWFHSPNCSRRSHSSMCENDRKCNNTYTHRETRMHAHTVNILPVFLILNLFSYACKTKQNDAMPKWSLANEKKREKRNNLQE